MTNPVEAFCLGANEKLSGCQSHRQGQFHRGWRGYEPFRHIWQYRQVEISHKWPECSEHTEREGHKGTVILFHHPKTKQCDRRQHLQITLQR